MKTNSFAIFLVFFFLICGNPAFSQSTSENSLPVRGFCIGAPNTSEVDAFVKFIAEELVPRKVNTLILRVDYNFQFESHPELCDSLALSKTDVKKLVDVCRKNQIRIIPQINLLGHQSWASKVSNLLKVYPQFDETPQVKMPKKYKWPNDDKLYCKSYCPLHPDLHQIVFELVDEICDVFETDAFHAGMDEVFILASDDCPRCKGKNTAELFAKAVNDLHNIIVRDLKMEMMIWGDRLLDDAKFKYGKWESSQNGTAPAIDKIPQDIIICDWHYELRNSYPSVDYFISKGFRVMPSSWKNEKAALAFLNYANNFKANPKLYGHLCTTWCSSGNLAKALSGEGEQSREVMEIATTTKTMLMKIPVSRK